MNLSILPCFCGFFDECWTVVRIVCGQFCGIFAGFRTVVGPMLHERCLSQVVPLCLVPEIALPRATNQCALCSNVHFSRFCSTFSCFFCVAVRTWSLFVQWWTGNGRPKYQRRLRYRVTGLRPSGLPNLPFSLVLPFPPFSSASLPFSLFFSNFSSFHPFPSSLLFFFPFFPTIFKQFSFTFYYFLLFPWFFGQSDASL